MVYIYYIYNIIICVYVNQLNEAGVIYNNKITYNAYVKWHTYSQCQRMRPGSELSVTGSGDSREFR